MRFVRAAIALVVVAGAAATGLRWAGTGQADVPGLGDVDWGEFTPLSPERILDTRQGIGAAANTPIGPGGSIEVVVAGRAGVPTSGVTAVVLNVTATEPTEPSFVTVHPAGTARPNASTVNVLRGQSVPNLAVAKLGAGGKLAVYNDSGATHVLFDVMGWYANSAAVGTKSRLRTISPSRLLDTRIGGTALGAGQSIDLQVTGRAEVPAGATAAVLNVTATRASAGTFVTVYPGDLAAVPPVSNLNAQPNQTVPNLVMVRLAANGTVKLYNYAGSTDVVVDVVGYYDRVYADNKGQVMAIPPTRKVDTRETRNPLGPNQVALMQFSTTNVGGVILNVTVTNPTEASFLTVFPATNGEQTMLPTASNLNFERAQTVANLVTVKVPPNGVVVFYNYAGTVDVVVDVVGLVS